VTACMASSSESWEPYRRPHLWHSRAGGGAVHSITNGLVHCKGKVGRLGKLVIRTETGPQIASAGSGARIDVMILSDSGSQNWPRAIPTVVSTAASAGRVGNPRAWIAVAMTKFANGISAKPINGQCSRIMSTRRGRDGL